MEVLKLTTEIDETGHLNINLPTNLEAGTVELVVVVNPATEKNKGHKKYDFSETVLLKTTRCDYYCNSKRKFGKIGNSRSPIRQDYRSNNR